jgi:hypothetical protein
LFQTSDAPLAGEIFIMAGEEGAQGGLGEPVAGSVVTRRHGAPALATPTVTRSPEGAP